MKFYSLSFPGLRERLFVTLQRWYIEKLVRLMDFILMYVPPWIIPTRYRPKCKIAGLVDHLFDNVLDRLIHRFIDRFIDWPESL